jgi:hypothetical protein
LRIKIIISDNGNQGLDSFRYNNINFDYINNSKYFDSKSHLDAIFNLNLSNFFYIHDDDQLHIVYLLEAMDFIKKYNPNCLISPKFKINDVVKFDNIKTIFKMYFLDPDNNCPLFSGIYFKNSSVVNRNNLLNNLIKGKYADVQFVSRILLSSKSYLFNLPYLNYVEHDLNDNKLRNLKDRVSLSKFIRSKKGISNFIISLLIFHGYKEKIKFFTLGIILAFLYPPTSYNIIKKALKKLNK